jgi:hypothetical protein
MSDQTGEPKPDATPAKSAAPTKRPLRAAPLVVLLVITLVAVGVTVATHRGAFEGQVTLSPQDRIAALETKVNQLGNAPTNAAPADSTNLKERIDALEARVAMLEGQSQGAAPDIAARLTAIEAQIARAGDRETQGELLARMARLESQNSGETLRRAASVLALATLARATRDSSPFRPELDALSGTEANDPVIATLQPIADTGAPTTAMLAARFADTARATLDAERKVQASSLFARLWASIAGLVSIRPVGSAEGNTTADRLARAEAALGRGDLAAAVRETEALSGPAAGAIAPWLKDARARLTIERAVAQMESRIVQALAAASSPSATP